MVELHCGDALEVLSRLTAGSVHCCVTSPPYWGLRDYGTAKWEGGDAECDHRENDRRNSRPHGSNSSFHGGDDSSQTHPFRDHCGKCGARRIDAQLGLEPTPEAYVARIVEVFREVRRVLRDDGTCWMNMGDSYASGEIGRHDALQSIGACNGKTAISLPGLARSQGKRQQARLKTGLKPKDLVGIPWRVAFALQADGWWLRSDIIWHKPNPMPESVRDRPTKSHEYVFLLSKAERYFFDAEAVREGFLEASLKTERKASGQAKRNVLGQMARTTPIGRTCGVHPSGRNIRTVWTIATEAYKGAHFATFPRKLVMPCIKAGSPEGGVVLDPFCGSGTTGAVAKLLGRGFIGIDLNPEYLELARKRIDVDASLLPLS